MKSYCRANVPHRAKGLVQVPGELQDDAQEPDGVAGEVEGGGRGMPGGLPAWRVMSASAGLNHSAAVLEVNDGLWETVAIALQLQTGS